MKAIYALFFLMFPFFLIAQQKTEQRVSIGIGQSHLHLLVSEHFEIYYTGSNHSTSSSITNSSARELGINLGYHLQLHPRWEMIGRINYSGNEVQESTTAYFYGLSSSTQSLLPDKRTRKYRALWSEALLFWRVLGERSLLDVQIGTGISHLYFYQKYNSGYTFISPDQRFDSKQTTIERKGSFGIPMQLQLQYPINYHWKIGGTLQANRFFNENQQTGFMVFMAYRW